MVQVKCIQSPSGIGCYQFLGGGTDVVYSLFVVTPIIYVFVLGPCCVMQYFVFFLVLRKYSVI